MKLLTKIMKTYDELQIYFDEFQLNYFLLNGRKNAFYIIIEKLVK